MHLGPTERTRVEPRKYIGYVRVYSVTYLHYILYRSVITIISLNFVPSSTLFSYASIFLDSHDTCLEYNSYADLCRDNNIRF